ncbi:MAG: hypothetical protein MUF60_04695, partial [Vicinamibacterales bacterium]|nr:hypothetical protein [Vicinamibacterales bacterium]
MTATRSRSARTGPSGIATPPIQQIPVERLDPDDHTRRVEVRLDVFARAAGEAVREDAFGREPPHVIAQFVLRR